MHKKIVLKLLTMAAAISFLASCGGGVQATAVASQDDINSDVAKGEVRDAQGGCTANNITVSADNPITVSITSLVKQSGTTINPINIGSVRIHFEGADTVSKQFPLPDDFAAISALPLSPGQSISVPVVVASFKTKSNPALQSLVCSGNVRNYYVTLSFLASDGSGSVDVQSPTLNIHFADFVD
jgi:hypothetical protein